MACLESNGGANRGISSKTQWEFLEDIENRMGCLPGSKEEKVLGSNNDISLKNKIKIRNVFLKTKTKQKTFGKLVKFLESEGGKCLESDIFLEHEGEISWSKRG